MAIKRLIFALLVLAGTVWPPSVGAQVRVVDDLGQPFVLPQPAARIVSLAPHITENLFAIGAGERVVGTVAYSDYPVEAQRIPRVGDYAGFSLEAVVALRPDLVIAWSDSLPAAQAQRIRALGIPLLQESPDSFDEIATSLRRLGHLSGATAGAETAARHLEQQIAQLKYKYGRSDKVRVFYQSWAQPLMTANGTQLVSQMIDLCGGENIFAGRPEVAPRIGFEAVIAAAPDLIIAAAETRDDDWRDRWRDWHQLEAVRAGRLYSVHPDLVHRATPRAVDGAVQLCESIRQGRFSMGLD